MTAKDFGSFRTAWVLAVGKFASSEWQATVPRFGNLSTGDARNRPQGCSNSAPESKNWLEPTGVRKADVNVPQQLFGRTTVGEIAAILKPQIMEQSRAKDSVRRLWGKFKKHFLLGSAMLSFRPRCSFMPTFVQKR